MFVQRIVYFIRLFLYGQRTNRHLVLSSWFKAGWPALVNLGTQQDTMSFCSNCNSSDQAAGTIWTGLGRHCFVLGHVEKPYERSGERARRIGAAFRPRCLIRLISAHCLLACSPSRYTGRRLIHRLLDQCTWQPPTARTQYCKSLKCFPFRIEKKAKKSWAEQEIVGERASGNG